MEKINFALEKKDVEMIADYARKGIAFAEYYKQSNKKGIADFEKSQKAVKSRFNGQINNLDETIKLFLEKLKESVAEQEKKCDKAIADLHRIKNIFDIGDKIK